jgi:hypothetical protein
LLDPTDFLSRVAKVMYLATKTRSDLLFTVSTLASRSSEPYEADVKSLNHLYDYINSNQTVPLKFKCDDMVLPASVDASHDIHRQQRPLQSCHLIGWSPCFPSIHKAEACLYLRDAGRNRSPL